MSKIRVLVAEDSATVRNYLLDILATDPAIEVVGEAYDGVQATRLCAQLRPDVITMDMMMPAMNGLAATEYIMAHCPTPILIVSSSSNRGEHLQGYEALAAGAVEMLEKPDGTETDEHWGRTFLSTLKIVSRIRVITHPRARLNGGLSSSSGIAPHSQPLIANDPQPPFRVIALGASTGGPSAIVDVLRSIPPTMSLPILFVLHISEPFGDSFIQWLGEQLHRPVAYAREGEPVAAAAGRVLMAPPGSHMIAHEGLLHLTDGPERHSCRPSVDTLFESVAREYGRTAIAGLLTGMGRDGAKGLLDINRAGGVTYAQDEATSVVYGMPREAKLMGAADYILPLREIGPAMARLVKEGRRPI